MKRKKCFLSICPLIMMLLLYLLHASTAMAAERTPVKESASDAQEILSTGKELTDWLDSHKYTGGRARLGACVTLEEPYLFVPRPNGPELVVETGSFTILVSSDVELWSDGRLTFQGMGGEHSVFRVKKGGSLLLDGINVECPSGQNVLWQEEGAGFIVGETFAKGRVSGNIHYAQKPFVMEAQNACVIVKQGESLYDSLPAEIKCRVSEQGQCLINEPVAVSWELAGTEKQQEERMRFQIEGSFPEAESETIPVCTVVYDDYPLTFTEVEALMQGNFYVFRGDYTKPEGELPIAAEVVYSFDGENWIANAEDTVSDVSDGFYLVFPCGRWDTARHSYVYIRIQGEEYASNVLRFAADNLKTGEDLGGGRGGGTSIVNPPSMPEEKPAGSQTESQYPFEEQSSTENIESLENSKRLENLNSSEKPKVSGDSKQSDQYQAQKPDPKKDGDAGSGATDPDRQSASGTGRLSQNNSVPGGAGITADIAAADNCLNDRTMADNRNNTATSQTAAMASSGTVLYAEQVSGQYRKLMIAGGIAFLAVLAGAVVYLWSGTKR